MTTHFFGLTDTGITRKNNEDSFIAEEMGSNATVLAAVIDGVGGYVGGEVAAAIAKEEFSKEFSGAPSEIIADMTAAFKRANQVIMKRKSSGEGPAEMACVATLVVADSSSNQFYYAHVGDTRLYLYRDGSLVKISKDHSFVGYLEDTNRLDERTAMSHPKRNEINKAIGFSELMETDESYIETGQSPFLPGDLLLMCSDGLTDMVNREEIIGLLSKVDTLKIKAANLVKLANENGGLDNITVVLVQNSKKPKEGIPIKSENIDTTDATPIDLPLGQPIVNQPMDTSPKLGYGFMALMLLSLILLGSTIYFYTQSQERYNEKVEFVDTVKHKRNSQELLLQDAFDNATVDTLVLSDSIFKSPILISDTLRIKRDSLIVIAKGMVLQADTNYKGAALILNAQNKLTGLDSLQFRGFKTAILVHNANLSLADVTFINCAIPVQRNYMFQNQTPVNAALGNSIPRKY